MTQNLSPTIGISLIFYKHNLPKKKGQNFVTANVLCMEALAFFCNINTKSRNYFVKPFKPLTKMMVTVDLRLTLNLMRLLFLLYMK